MAPKRKEINPDQGILSGFLPDEENKRAVRRPARKTSSIPESMRKSRKKLKNIVSKRNPGWELAHRIIEETQEED